MKTAVVVSRQFNGVSIRQDSKTGFLNLNDLHDAYIKTQPGNDKPVYEYLRTKQTQEFVEAIRESILENQKQNPVKSTELLLPLVEPIPVIQTRRGKYGGSWAHPYVFLDFAMWLNPKFKVWAMSVIEDKLIELRNEAGDRFIDMAKALKSIGAVSPREYIQECNMINILVFGSTKSGQRNEATKEQLALLNKLQKYNAHLITQNISFTLRSKECANFLKFYDFIK